MLEAQKNIKADSAAYVSMSSSGTDSKFFHDESRTNAHGMIQYLGVKEVPSRYLSQKQKESGKKYFLPIVELTTIVVDYKERDTYDDCKTTLYLEYVQSDKLVFQNHKSAYGEGYCDKSLVFGIKKDGSVSATEDHGHGVFVESAGSVRGDLYNQIIKAKPSTVQGI